MVVQHNMQAANANRMLNITTGAQRNFLLVIELTVQLMTQPDYQFLRR